MFTEKHAKQHNILNIYISTPHFRVLRKWH